VPAPTGVQVYDALQPSLVLVRTEAGTGGLGSGVVVNEAGQVLTAHHVLNGATEVEVVFADGTRSGATVVTADPANDLALLAPTALPDVVVPAVLGGGVRIGDAVYPLGNPFGFTGTLTAGVVSGLGRTLQREDGAGELSELIQFDAAVNPGSSGGPLVDAGGQVVGIVTALANPTQQRTFVGLGFAVPITTAGGVTGSIER
jgi:S1-C subfamily serine protease